MVPTSTNQIHCKQLELGDRQRLWHDVGHTAAGVFEVLLHHADADGIVEMTHGVLATESAASERTVRRAVERLVETSWLDRTYQHRDDHQAPNRYRIASPQVGPDGHNVQLVLVPEVGQETGDLDPGGQIDQGPGGQNGHLSKGEVDTEEVVDVLNGEEVLVFENLNSSPDKDAQGSALLALESDEVPAVAHGHGHGHRGVVLDIRSKKDDRRHVLDPGRLVNHFKALLQQENPRKISVNRLEGWDKTAAQLIFKDRRPVREVAEIISWIFESYGGYCPTTGEHLTRLWPVRDTYDELLAMMTEERQKAQEPPVAPTVAEDENVAQIASQAPETATAEPSTATIVKAPRQLWSNEPWHIRRKRILAERQQRDEYALRPPAVRSTEPMDTADFMAEIEKLFAAPRERHLQAV